MRRHTSDALTSASLREHEDWVAAPAKEADAWPKDLEAGYIWSDQPFFSQTWEDLILIHAWGQGKV